jgi:hypothetical protein
VVTTDANVKEASARQSGAHSTKKSTSNSAGNNLQCMKIRDAFDKEIYKQFRRKQFTMHENERTF